MTMETLVWAVSLSLKPMRITSRAITLIANRTAASTAICTQRCLIASSPDVLRLRAADESRLGIVAPGELLARDLFAILADDAPCVLGETWESAAGDASRAGLAVDRRRRGDVTARAADGLHAVVDLGAPHRDGHRPAGVRRVDQDPVRRGVPELHIQRGIEDRGLDHRRIPGEVERVRLVLDVLQARVVRGVEQRRGEL